MDIYDIVILGGGPAGLSAGLYGSRAKLNVLVIEKENFGGQAATTVEIENYPGSMENCTGPVLTDRMKKQAEDFGTQFVNDEVVDVDFSQDIKVIKCKNNTYHAKAVIIATGAQYRLAGFKNEMEFRGRGVSYCATCDAGFYEGLNVAVIGGGDTALTEALHITKYAESVTIIHRRDSLRAAKYLQDRAFNNPKIKFIWNTVVEEAKGDEILDTLILRNIQTGEVKEFKIDGVFVCVGLIPNSEVFKGKVAIDENGYIITDRNMKTNVEGVFAAGDVIQKTLRQVITATSDGAVAAVTAEEYIMNRFEK